MNLINRSTLPEILSYDLQVAVWADGVPIQVDGKLEVRNLDSSPLQRITLYLHPELNVTSVTTGDGQSIVCETTSIAHDWSYTKSLAAHSLTLADPIAAGDVQILQLSYEGSFSPSSVRSPSDFMRIDEEGSHLRGLGYSLWFPITVCSGIDAAANFRIHLDVPLEWTGVAFGNLERVKHSGQRTLSWWKTESPFKLIQAQLFASILEVFEGKNLSVFAKKCSSESALKLIVFGDQILDSFAHNYGAIDVTTRNYVVETCPYGRIASGNVIGLSPDVFQSLASSTIDFETYDLIAHEFVHGYVTPLIDRDALGSALLLEGFPSYFHVPSVTDVLGDDYHDWFFRRAWHSYRNGVKKQAEGSGDASIPIDKPLLEIGIDEIPYYKDRFLLSDRFPILLDQLREQLGSSVSLGASKDFFAEGRRRLVTVADFFRFLEIHSEEDLSHFVARWMDTIRPLPESWEKSLQAE